MIFNQFCIVNQEKLCLIKMLNDEVKKVTFHLKNCHCRDFVIRKKTYKNITNSLIFLRD